MKQMIVTLGCLVALVGCGKAPVGEEQVGGNYSGTINGQASTAIIGQSGSAVSVAVILADGSEGQLSGYLSGETLTRAVMGMDPSRGPCGTWIITVDQASIIGGELTGSISGSTTGCGSIQPEVALTLQK